MSGAGLLTALILAGGLTFPAGAALAQARVSGIAQVAEECARLRADLDRAHREIAVLKGQGGVRNDYLLRQRMADAEAVARRLIAAEAELRRLRGAPSQPDRTPSPVAPAEVTPGDGPIEIEAKADLLADQARRLATEADALVRAAGQIRGRQTLRRRAGLLDRDPFASLDASKRTMVFGVRGTRPQPAENSFAKELPGPGVSAPPPPGVGAPADLSRAAAPAAPDTPPPPAVAATPMLSPQYRTLLDPATLAAVSRIEKSGRPWADAEALEKAAAALRERARALDGRANALRSRR